MPHAAGPSHRQPSSEMTARTRNIAIGIAILTVAAFFLNPDEQEHDSALRGGIARKAPVASLLGGGRVASWLSTYHDLGVASYTEIDGRVRTMGALGIVVVR